MVKKSNANNGNGVACTNIPVLGRGLSRKVFFFRNFLKISVVPLLDKINVQHCALSLQEDDKYIRIVILISVNKCSLVNGKLIDYLHGGAYKTFVTVRYLIRKFMW